MQNGFVFLKQNLNFFFHERFFTIKYFRKGLLFLCLNSLDSIFRNKFSITGITSCMLKIYFFLIQNIPSEII